MVCENFLSILDFLHLGCIMSVFCMQKCIFRKLFIKNVILPFQELLRSSIIRQIDLLVAKYFVMAFTLCNVKMFVVVKCLQERALPNEFCSQMSIIYFVCCIFDSNSSWFCFQLHKFANILWFVGIQN